MIIVSSEQEVDLDLQLHAVVIDLPRSLSKKNYKILWVNINSVRFNVNYSHPAFSKVIQLLIPYFRKLDL